MEGDAKGSRQPYRHCVHPRCPRAGFAGFNHGFAHVAGVVIGTLWLTTLWRGELLLTTQDEMDASCARVAEWKTLTRRAS
jgi:hypothetical protein